MSENVSPSYSFSVLLCAASGSTRAPCEDLRSVPEGEGVQQGPLEARECGGRGLDGHTRYRVRTKKDTKEI